MLCKALALEGVLLWCYTEVEVPLVAGQATYNLSALLSGGMLRDELNGVVAA